MSDGLDIRQLEELVLNTSAPRHQLLHGGWLIRLSRDDVKRARSVTTLECYGDDDLATRIAWYEERFAESALVPLFRLSPASSPPDLDQALAARGYQVIEPTLVQIARLTDELPTPAADWPVVALALERWVDEVARLRRSTRTARDNHLGRMLNHGLPTHQVAAYSNGEIIASGSVVIDGDYAGILDMFTREDHRGRGLGQSILHALLSYAHSDGVPLAWLGVLATNSAALALYAKFGFRTVYQYWYRLRTAAVVD